MNKILKKSLSVFLAVVMMVSAVPLGGFVGIELPNFGAIFSFAADEELDYIEAPASDFTYTALNGTYCSITGYTGNDTAIIIPDEINGYIVQQIANNAFKDNKKLEGVMLPTTLETLGSSVFSGCTSLKEIVLNEGLKTISSYAFQNCSSLSDISFSNTVITINSYAFQNCTSLESIELPNSITAMASRAFYNCTKLSEVNFPLSWASVLDYEYNGTSSSDGNYRYCSPFDGCSSLTTIAIPNGVASVPKHAFRYLSSLETITFGDTIEKIDKYAFNGCTGIKELVFGEGLTTIESNAFEGSTGIATITFNDNLTTINSYAFNGCSGIKELIFNESLKTISDNAFNGCSGMEEITFNDGLTTINSRAFNGCKSLTEISIPESVTTLETYVFANCTGLQEITLPETLTTIKSYAFQNCTSLESIELPNSITEMASRAFYNCTKLSEVNFPLSWKNVLDYEYNGTSSSDGSYRYSSPFDGCSSLTTIAIPNGVASVPKHAFRYLSSLETITFGDTIEKIDKYAFNGCTGIKELVFGEGLTTIESNAFEGSTGITTITFNDNLTTINSYAFNGCSGIKNIFFDDSLTTINSYAFNGCTGLKEIKIPDNVTVLNSYIFSNCTGLQKIDLPKEATIIYSHAFENCTSAKNITMPEALTTIQSYAFQNCTSLESIELPNSITAMASRAFYNCTKLSEVNFPLSWTSVLDYEYNGTSSSDGNYRYCSPFDGCSSLTTIAIPNGVASVPKHAFRYLSSLETITFGDTIEKIDKYAFNGCTGIKELVFGEGLTTIESYAFNGCTGINELIFEESLSLIGNNAFENCSGLRLIKFAESIKTINSYAFSHCDGVLSIVLNDGLETISNGAFANCANITAITVPKETATVAAGCFDNCPKLTVYCYSNSAAHLTCESKGYNFFLLDDHEHNYMSTIETSATCEKAGSQILTCTLCGYNYIDFIDALGHDYSDEWTIDSEATCTVEGSKSHHCSRCDSVANVTPIPAAGHKYGAYVVTNSATCTGKGQSQRVCSVCGFTDVLTTDELGHDFEEQWTTDKEASCTSDGSKSHHCSRCDAKSDVTVITRLPHSLKATKVVLPTCTAQGYTVYTCSVCGNTVNDNYEDAVGHSFGDWNLIREADCINRGYSIRKCSVCNTEEREYTNALGHSFGEWEIEVNPTVLADGKKAKTCSVCGTKEYQKIDRLVVDINKNANYGLANFTVVDIDLNPIKGACIYIYTEKDGENTFTTDINGKVSIVLPVGKQMIQAYADGLHTRQLTVNITSGEQNIHPITLSKDELVDAEINVKEMSYEDIINAGIDVEAADNKQVYKWELKLTYEAIPEFNFEYFTTTDKTTGEKQYFGSYSSSSSKTYYPGNSYVVNSAGYQDTRNVHSTNVGIRTVMNLDMTGYSQGDNISFGSYPQSQVTSSALLKSLNSQSFAWETYPVRVGDGNYEKTGIDGKLSKVMYYADVEYNGNMYRALKIDNYRPALTHDISASYTSYQDDNGYYIENIYWFKYEPINWVVLKQNTNSVFVMADKAIDSQCCGVDSGDTTGIKSWLNNEFALTAFSTTERSKIVTTKVSNCWCGEHLFTYEKLYLLSVKDVETADYGFFDFENDNAVYNFDLRCAKRTDYSKALGLFDDLVFDRKDFGAWWIRGLGEPSHGGGYSGTTISGGIGKGTGANGTPFTIYPVAETEEELFYLVIWGEVHWLKEMFDVEMIVINKSKTDTIENCTATLDLPDGLSLATMVNGEQSLAQTIDFIDSDSTESLHWYIRGDKEGYYNVSADLTGKLMPFEEEFNYKFTASDSVHVYAGSAMHMTFRVPDGCYEGHDAVITIELENVSDKTLYNVSSFITDVFQYDSYYLNEDEDGLYYHAKGGEVVPWQTGYAQKFEPGDKIILEVSTNILFHSRFYDNIAEAIEQIADLKKMYDACKKVIDIAGAFDGVLKVASGNIDSIIKAGSISSTEVANSYRKLASSLTKLYTKLAGKPKSKIANIGITLMSSNIWDTITEIANGKWDYDLTDAKEIGKLITNLESIISASDEESIDPFELIEDVVSLLPIRYQLINATVSTREGSTTSIPYSIITEHIESPYKGVINMGSIIYDAVIAGMGKMDVGLVYRMLGAPDDPTGYNRAIQSLKTARDTLKALHVRAGVKDTRVKAWVVTKDSQSMTRNNMLKSSALLANNTDDITYSNGFVELSVGDNDTARIVNGVLEFDGNATLNVKALNSIGGTLYVDMGDGDVFEYDIEVVEEHKCSSDNWVTVLAAIGESPNYQACYCDICNELIGFREVKSCNAHNFNDWTTTLEATCLIGGIKTRECSVCGYTETGFTDATGHTEETRNAVEADCLTDGYTGDVYCSICDELISEGEIIKTSGHDYVGVPTAPTCTTDGYTTYTCSVCGNSYVDDTVISDGHTYSDWTTKTSATCENRGLEHRICSICSAEETREINALGHKYSTDWTIDKDSTCKEEGSKSHHCTRCDSKTDVTAIAKKEHTYVDSVVAPTCTTDGYTSHTCSVCGTSYTDAVTTKTGHYDDDGDGYCDKCNIDLGTHEPDDPSENCSCNCHKSGISKFFWKLINFFHKLFKMEKYHYCDCGNPHW